MVLQGEERALAGVVDPAFLEGPDYLLFWWLAFGLDQELAGEDASVPPIPPLKVVDVRLADDRALVIVAWEKDGVPYRQARVYRRAGPRWLRTAAEDDLWGAPRQRETGCLYWKYRDLDDTVVSQMAAWSERACRDLKALWPIDATFRLTVTLTTAMDAAGWAELADHRLTLRSPWLWRVRGDEKPDAFFLMGLAAPLVQVVLADSLNVSPSRLYASAASGAGARALDAIHFWQVERLGVPMSQLFPNLSANAPVRADQVSRPDDVARGREGMAYLVSMVRYLEATYGPETVVAFARALPHTPRLSAALAQAIGPTYDEDAFVAGWRRYLSR